jgi:hypothetical protein
VLVCVHEAFNLGNQLGPGFINSVKRGCPSYAILSGSQGNGQYLAVLTIVLMPLLRRCMATSSPRMSC